MLVNIFYFRKFLILKLPEFFKTKEINREFDNSRGGNIIILAI